MGPDFYEPSTILRTAYALIFLIHLRFKQNNLPQLFLYSYKCYILNVPVIETGDFILNNKYNNGAVAAPNTQRETIESLLLLYTSESPFRSPDSKLYYQINGVAMESPLWLTFAEFYMCDLENRVLLSDHLKPNLYARYVDDILVVVRNEQRLNPLKMEAQFVLSFTFEMNINNSMSFLDVKIHQEKMSMRQLCSESPQIQENVSILMESVQTAARKVSSELTSSDHLFKQEFLRI